MRLSACAVYSGHTDLLENAIEAARQTDTKYLNVYIALQKGVLKIQVDNSFVPEAISEKEGRDGSKIFLTTKRRKEQHGIGLKNVKKLWNYTMEIWIYRREGEFSVLS